MAISSRRRTRSSAWLVGALGIGLIVSGGGLSAGVTAAAVAPASSAASPSEETDLSRPDRVSAMVTARASGERVEDESQRDAFSRVYANPDGTWTSESATQPESAQDADGEWHDIDASLVAGDGGLVPRYAAADLRLSNGGDKVFAAMSQDGKDLEWRWPTMLPEPTVEGDAATYAGVAAGGVGDLVVTANGTGFSYDVVLHEQPAAPLDLAVPVVTDGAVLSETAQGSLEVTTKAGDTIASAAPPVMYDASVDEQGDPTNVVPVDTTVGASAGATTKLTLSPDEDYLADPGTVYPVTVDPTFTNYASGDTWVSKPEAGNQVPSPELRVGTPDTGTTKYRSFINFDYAVGQLQEKISNGREVGSLVQFRSASLVMRNFASLSCAGSPIRVSAVNEAWGGNTITWANQPLAGRNPVDYSPAAGYDAGGCGATDAAWDVSATVRDWVAGGFNDGFRVMAADETVNKGYRRYRSANYETYPGLSPHLNITYNVLPGESSYVGWSPITSYTPAGGATTWYTNSKTPTFSGSAPDPDGDTIGLLFRVGKAATPTTEETSCQGPAVPQSSSTSCTIPKQLPDGTYTVRAKAGDYYNWAGGSLEAAAGWGPLSYFTVDTTAPPAPTISADNATENVWGATQPQSNTFTLIGPADTASFSYQEGNGTIRTAVATNGIAKVSWNPPNGWRALTVQTKDRAGNTGPWKTFEWGVGRPAIATTSKIPTFTNNFPLSISGPPDATGARLKWRYASEDGWNDATKITDVDGDTWTGSITQGVGASEANELTWAATQEEVPDAAEEGDKIKAPALLETQACFSYAGGKPDSCSPPTTLQLVESAFGSNFPVTDVGAGRVALWSGEFAADATDVSVAGGAGSTLSVSRSYGSYTGPAVPAAKDVFGPGWTASLDGTEAGMAGLRLIDNTLVDGTLVLSDPTGETMVFAPKAGWDVRTDAMIAPDNEEWEGVDELTPQLGLKAEVQVDGGQTWFVVTDSAGAKTTFLATTAPAAPTQSNPGTAVFAAESVQEPGAGKTIYDRDSLGRVTRIIGALPERMTAADCTATSWAAGCRALEVGYAASTTANSSSPGDVTGQVQRIQLRVFDAANPAGATTPLSSYAYGTDKRLRSVTDELTGLTTRYGYSDGRLATLTPPGLTPYQLEYDGARSQLSRVKRERPAASGGGTATLATVVYGLRPTTLDMAGLPDLRLDVVKDAWGQGVRAVYGAAVFGPEKAVSTTDPDEIDADDWEYASLWYTDFRGRTINTASYGAGQWQPTYTAYNNLGNPERELSAGDIAAIQSGALNAQDAGTETVYNTATDGPADTSPGTVVTDVYGPARMVRSADGTPAVLRSHTRTTYDEGSPEAGINPATGEGWAMPTTVTTDAVDPLTKAVVGDPVSVVKTAYGDTAGWTLGLPTTSTTVMGGGQANIVTTTGYDNAGRVIEQRQPRSNGADAGTRRTVYYTKAPNDPFPSCGGKPDWEGMPCSTSYAGDPGNGPARLTTTVDGYDQFLLPATTTETSGTVTRTTSTVYDDAGRLERAWTTLKGATSVPGPGTELEYDSTTGLPTNEWATDASGARTSEHIDTGYDSWGRTTTYTPSGDAATTTTYDSYGRVASVEDPKGTTTYTYDGADAAGKTERRGLPTSLAVSAPSGNIEFGGAYDANGNLVLETLPGGIKRRTTYDTASQQVGLSYSGTVNRPDGDGTTVDPDAPWLAWDLDRDIAGRVTGETTPDAAAPTGKLAGGTAAAYSRGYSYDRAGRLTKVIDRTAPSGAAQYDAGGNLVGATCQTREYEFDANGNRTGLTRRGADADGSCSTAVASTKSWSYDAADRYAAGSGYSYDNLGRVTTLPAVDTPMGSTAGAITLEYYDTDEARRITQDGTSSTYTLDAAGRRTVEKVGPVGESPTSTVTSHFTDDTDSPTWAEATTGGSTVTTRFLGALHGDLGAVLVDGSSLTLALANPHGDTVATAGVPATGAAAGIDSWSSYDEYGSTVSEATATPPLKTATGVGYGWLGANQRAVQASGLVLMGARIYNSQTGSFTSVDPVFGGNSTAYAYPQDPVNFYDLTGENALDSPSGGGMGRSPSNNEWKKVRKKAERLLRQIRKNSLYHVRYETKNGRVYKIVTRYDFAGKSHTLKNGQKVPTPHVQITRSAVGANGKPGSFKLLKTQRMSMGNFKFASEMGVTRAAMRASRPPK